MILKKELVCPKCRNRGTFYVKRRYSGTCNLYFEGNGELGDNTEMYDYADHRETSKFVFCFQCESKVGKIEELVESWADI